jgi:hypothetical protein
MKSRTIKPFTREEVLELFDADSNSPSGLVWRVAYKEKRKGDTAGYVVPTRSGKKVWHVCFNGRPHLVHRIVWALEMGDIPTGLEIDHINGKSDDNRLENLSLKTRSYNARARAKMDCRNRSGFNCVSWHSMTGKWLATCRRKGIRHYFGLFEDKVEAAKVVDEFLLSWSKDNNEECRLLNFPN